MQYQANSSEHYINQLTDERKEPIRKLRAVIKFSLPKDYYCSLKSPLPFLNLASQKNSFNFYHMGIYAKPELHDWFLNEYP